jgi:hypothetical protein
MERKDPQIAQMTQIEAEIAVLCVRARVPLPRRLAPVHNKQSVSFGDRSMWAVAGDVICAVGVLLLIQPGVALWLAHLANATNTMGMAWAALCLWIVVSVAVFVLYRNRIPLAVRVPVMLGCFVLSVYVYILVGYHVLGWTGLRKG